MASIKDIRFKAIFDSKNVTKGLGKIQTKTAQTTAKMKAGFAKVQTSVKGLASSFSGLLPVLGVAAIGKFLKDTLEVFGIQELAEKKLSASLGFVNQRLLDQAAALQKVSVFGDEQIIESQALISAFTKEESNIKALTKASLDLASAKGFDLRTAADLIAKSFGSSTNALTRYGIEVTGAVGSTERLTTLTENIAKLFGGQAKAEAETFTGSIKQMSNAFGDLQEQIGSTVAPTLTKLFQGLTKQIVNVGKKGFLELVGDIALFNAKMVTGTFIIEEAADALFGYESKFKDISTVVDLTGTNLAEFFSKASSGVGILGDKNLFAKPFNLATASVNKLNDELKEVTKQLNEQNKTSTLSAGLRTRQKEIEETIKFILTGQTSELKKQKKILEGFSQPITGGGDKPIKTKSRGLFEPAFPKFTKDDLLVPGVSKSFEKAKEGFAELSELSSLFISTLQSEFSQAWESIFGEANSLFEKFISKAVESIAVDLLGGLLSFLPGGSILSGIGSLFGLGGSSGSSDASSFGGGIETKRPLVLMMDGKRVAETVLEPFLENELKRTFRINRVV